MRTHHQIYKQKAVKLSFGTRRRKPCMLSLKSHGTMAVDVQLPSINALNHIPGRTNNVFEENVFKEDDTINESSDDEKCQVLTTNEKEDTEVSSDEDLFHNEIDEGTTAESPIDLTWSDESSDEEADNEA